MSGSAFSAVKIFISSARPGHQLIHEADVALRPICGQTNAEKNETWQRDLSGPVTCRKCLLLRAQLNAINANENLNRS